MRLCCAASDIFFGCLFGTPHIAASDVMAYIVVDRIIDVGQ